MDTSYFSPIAKQALAAFNQQNYSEAATLFSKAVIEYDNENKPLLAAEMKNNQSVSLLQENQAQSALDCLIGVVELFEKVDDSHKAGLTHGNMAAAYEALNNYKLAAEHCYKAADFLREGDHREEYTMIMSMLVSIQMKQGKIFEAAGSAHLFVDQIPNPTFRQRVLKMVYTIYKFFTKLFTR